MALRSAPHLTLVETIQAAVADVSGFTPDTHDTPDCAPEGAIAAALTPFASTIDALAFAIRHEPEFFALKFLDLRREVERQAGEIADLTRAVKGLQAWEG